jgi:SAM-dependent methyltransferase
MPRDWDARYAAEPTLWGSEPNQYVRARLGSADPAYVVDIACGNGRNALWLARRGWRVTGVDISGVAIERARERGKELGVEVEWVHGDVRTWAPAEPVAVALVSYLHLPTDELITLLRGAAGWLRPDGRLLYIGHSRTNHSRGVGGPSEPEVLAEIADLAAAAEGLRTVSLEHVLRETDNGTAIDILLEVTLWPTLGAGEKPDDEHPGVTRQGTGPAAPGTTASDIGAGRA